MKTFVCKKCHVEKPLTDFYKSKSNINGVQGICKDCYKERVRNNYLKNSQSDEYIEKERARGREKYKRLNYKERITDNKIKKEKKYKSLRGAKKAFNISISSQQELHHWNYNITNEVILLDRKLHHRFHTTVSFDLDSGIYYKGDVALDTLYKHMLAIKDVCDNFGFDYSKVQILRK